MFIVQIYNYKYMYFIALNNIFYNKNHKYSSMKTWIAKEHKIYIHIYYIS